MDAVTRLLDVCVIAFAATFREAPETSPLRRARVVLGDRRFADTVSRVMHAAATDVLLGDVPTRIVELQVCGSLAILSMIADVLQRTVRDVIRASQALSCAH